MAWQKYRIKVTALSTAAASDLARKPFTMILRGQQTPLR